MRIMEIFCESWLEIPSHVEGPFVVYVSSKLLLDLVETLYTYKFKVNICTAFSGFMTSRL